MWWTIAKALFALIPFLIQLYNEGKIREATKDEILAAMASVWTERITAAKAARDGKLVPEDEDPFNRNRSLTP